MEIKSLFRYLLSDVGVYENKNIYLYFEKDTETLRHIMFMLDYFYELGCRVYGLAGKEQNDVGIRVFNKKVVCYSELAKEKDVVVKWGGVYACEDDIERPFFNLNSEILKKKSVIIWGTGAVASKLCEIADKYGWKLSFFVDSNISKVGKKFKNRKIQNVDVLKTLSDKSILIEAAYKWETMEKTAEKLCPKTQRFYCEKLSVLNLKRDFSKVYSIYATIGDRNICIFGKKESVNKFYKFYQFLDFNVDRKYCYDSEEELEQQTIEQIKELSHEGWHVLLTRKKRVCEIESLEKAGMKYCNHFGYADQFEAFRCATRGFVYDINLGHSYQKECKYPGIAVYGDEVNAKCKIACLGNSTTDAYLFPFKSWPEYLKQIVEGGGEKRMHL